MWCRGKFVNISHPHPYFALLCILYCSVGVAGKTAKIKKGITNIYNKFEQIAVIIFRALNF